MESHGESVEELELHDEIVEIIRCKAQKKVTI